MASNRKQFKQGEITALFRRVLSTDDGKDLFEILKDRFRRPSIMPMQVTDGTALVPLTLYRVGEENVIRYIENILEREIVKDE